MCQGALCEHAWLSMALGRWPFMSRVGTLSMSKLVGVWCGGGGPCEHVCVHGQVYVVGLQPRSGYAHMWLYCAWPAGGSVLLALACVAHDGVCAMCGMRACAVCPGGRAGCMAVREGPDGPNGRVCERHTPITGGTDGGAVLSAGFSGGEHDAGTCPSSQLTWR